MGSKRSFLCGCGITGRSEVTPGTSFRPCTQHMLRESGSRRGSRSSRAPPSGHLSGKCQLDKRSPSRRRCTRGPTQHFNKGPRCARAVEALFLFCCCPTDRTCPLHRLNRPADGSAPDGLCRRCAYFLPQSIRCLPFGLRRLRRAQLREAPPAAKKTTGEKGSWPVT
jgi:hypothetical protein